MPNKLRAGSISLVAILGACGGSSSTAAPSTEDAAASTATPSAEAAPVASSSPAEPEPEPKGSCQRYLELYEDCEPRLQADIQAGNRRTFRAEQARLDYIAKTPEVADLADACASWLPELEKACL